MPETLNENFKFIGIRNIKNYLIIKTDSLGSVTILSSGAYETMKSEYLKHNYTPLDGYYIVEVESRICRVVK